MSRLEDPERERADSASEIVDEEEVVTLLGSPLEKSSLGRFFVYGGPLGLAVAIMLSLWVSYWHVRHTALVQVETRWEPGEQLALRASIVPEQPGPVNGAQVLAWVEQGDERYELGALELVPSTTVLHGTFEVPSLHLGDARLHLQLQAESMEPMHEIVPIVVVEQREVIEATPMVSGSTLQYGDDTDPQPPGMRIVVRPFGRMLAGFENTMLVRVLHPDGRPYRGPVEVALADGELMGLEGDPETPPVLVRESTDRLGVVIVEGPLMSEVVRIEVRVASRSDPSRVLHRRRMRMVSYAGAVVAELEPLAVPLQGDRDRRTLELRVDGLGKSRPVFVDVHGPDGAFIDTLEPFAGREPPREWVPPKLEAGLVQIEAYHFIHDPGESTAVARVQIASSPIDDEASLDALVELHREALDVPRVEQGFDRELERAYLDWLAGAELDPGEVEMARRWLIGTLPTTVHGPPTALVTRDRDLRALAEKQRRWTIGLRIFLLGGGGLFLVAMTWIMVRAHERAAASTQRELERLTHGEGRSHVLEQIRRARRVALLRGLGVVAVMAGGLVLTSIMLESLVWIF